MVKTITIVLRPNTLIFFYLRVFVHTWFLPIPLTFVTYPTHILLSASDILPGPLLSYSPDSSRTSSPRRPPLCSADGHPDAPAGCPWRHTHHPGPETPTPSDARSHQPGGGSHLHGHERRGSPTAGLPGPRRARRPHVQPLRRSQRSRRCHISRCAFPDGPVRPGRRSSFHHRIPDSPGPSTGWYVGAQA